jgi:hypothetical protein
MRKPASSHWLSHFQVELQGLMVGVMAGVVVIEF